MQSSDSLCYKEPKCLSYKWVWLQKLDILKFQFITDEVTNHLFEDKKKPHSGMDLASLNIQRSRDHGIPGYNLYRAICNLTRFSILQLIYLSNHKEFHFCKKGLP